MLNTPPETHQESFKMDQRGPPSRPADHSHHHQPRPYNSLHQDKRTSSPTDQSTSHTLISPIDSHSSQAGDVVMEIDLPLRPSSRTPPGQVLPSSPEERYPRSGSYYTHSSSVTSHRTSGGLSSRTGPMTRTSSTESASSSPQKVKLQRSKTGCLTCRAKRIKCSETKPICSQCTEHDRTCKWQGGTRTGKIQSLQPRVNDVSGAQTMSRAYSSSAVIESWPRSSHNGLEPDQNGHRQLGESPEFRSSVNQRPRRASVSDAQWPSNSSDASPQTTLPASHASAYTIPHTPAVSPDQRRSSFVRPSPNGSTYTMSAPHYHAATPASLPPVDLAADTCLTPARRTSLQYLTESALSSKLYVASTAFGLKALQPQPLTDSFTTRAPSVPTDLVLWAREVPATTSTPNRTIAALRSAALTRFTSGIFELSYGEKLGSPAQTNFFVLVVLPVLSDLEPSATLLIHDISRFRSPLQLACFQEGVVHHLRRTVGSSFHLLRSWTCSLFLYAQAIEIGSYTAAEYHLINAISCFRGANIRAVYRGVNTKEEHTLLYLTEVTFRLSSQLSLLTQTPLLMLPHDLPEPIAPYDLLMRTLFLLRGRAFDLVSQSARLDHHFSDPSHQPPLTKYHDTIAREFDSISSQLFQAESQFARLCDPSTFSRQPHTTSGGTAQVALSPFGYRAYTHPGYTALAMLFLQCKLAIGRLSSRALVAEYFALYAGLMHPVTHQRRTCVTHVVDTVGLLVCGGLLEDEGERRWLRTMMMEGEGGTMTMGDCANVVQGVWHATHSIPTQIDIKIVLPIVQHAVRSIMTRTALDHTQM
ncbi:hypothetical protein PYCC9005_004290 [Savitreella phatthalungensis]